MKYLSGEGVLAIHSELIDQTGGLHGIRDTGLFLSIVDKPKAKFSGRELYPGIFIKAAVVLHAFVTYHVFVDGNKRTGAAAAARLLFLNGYELTATNKELEKFVLEIAHKKHELEPIAAWLKRHSKKTPKRRKSK